MEKATKIVKALVIVATLVFCAWSTVRIVKAVQFDMNCTQYIKRAADANTVELAKYVSTKCGQIFYLSDNPLILLPKLLYIFQSSLNKTN